MSRTDTLLYDATLDGLALEIEHLDDTFEKAIARYDIPYRDGALLEDMGQKARTVKFRCYFWDDGAGHYTYADHVDFIAYLSNREFYELVHPMYGPLTGCIESVAVRHDDREMLAEIDISFVEQLRGDYQAVEYEDIAAAAEESFLAAQDEQQQDLADDLADEGLDTETLLDPEQSLADQINGGTTYLRDLVKELDSCLAGIDAEVAEIMQPVNSLTATITYAANLPGRVIGIVTRAVERVAKLYDTIRSFPDRFMNSLKFALKKLINTLATFTGRSKGGAAARRIMVKQLRIASAQRIALEVASIYADDEKRRQVVRKGEKTTAYSLDGRYIKQSIAEPVATVQALESSLADTRELIRDAVTGSRQGTALKGMARSLLEHVNSVKLEREKIVTVVLDNPMPLHLVCLRYGLPYAMADRICSINTFVNPSMITGAVSIYGQPGVSYQ